MGNFYYVIVFDQGEAGELFQVGEPRLFDTEVSATRAADDLASQHSGVLGFTRDAKDGVGKSPRSKIFYSAGEVLEVN